MLVPGLSLILSRFGVVEIQFIASYKSGNFGFVIKYKVKRIDLTVYLAIHY